jgi:hypothetical protein
MSLRDRSFENKRDSFRYIASTETKLDIEKKQQ